MKRYKDTEPANLYRDCWEYVVACVMGSCDHLRREDAEDIVSDSFLELYVAGVTTLANWVWISKKRGYSHYERYYSRYQHTDNLVALFDSVFSHEKNIEVFSFCSLFQRVSAKTKIALLLQGYNRPEIVKLLNCSFHSVDTIRTEIKKRATNALRNDIKLFHNQ